MQYLIQLLISGLAIGAIYGLIAMGFAVIYKSTGLVNFAQGEMTMITAYIAWTISTTVSGNIFIVTIGAILAAVLLGLVIERLVMRPMLGEPLFVTVMVTIGLAVILRSSINFIWDAYPHGLDIEAECDPERVAQILRILLDNALTHTGTGTSIEIRALVGESNLDGRAAAELTVADDGLGISSRDLPYVFDRFHTGDAGRGSGLGLAIARELAERMHGRLEASSGPGRTVFRLLLPLAHPDMRGRGRDAVAYNGPRSAGRTPA